MPTIKKVTDLIINKVESQKVYDYMVSQNLINDDELYLIEDKELITIEDIDTICIIPIEIVPYQVGTLTYNGTVQSPVWIGYDSSQLTISGATSATNAGTYTATFTPNSGYAWSDGSKDAKSISWTIGKAVGSLSISPTTLTLNSDATSGTITVTRAGDGAISAVSSDTSVATVSVSDNVITVTSVDSASGTATITISVAAGTNHTAPSSVTCEVTAEFVMTTVWFRFDRDADALNSSVSVKINNIEYGYYLNQKIEVQLSLPAGASISIYAPANIYSEPGFFYDEFADLMYEEIPVDEPFSYETVVPDLTNSGYYYYVIDGYTSLYSDSFEIQLKGD